MRILTMALAAGLLTSGTALAQDMKAKDPDQANAMMDIGTQDFAKTATGSNAFEIQSSEMAQKKASAADVKAFADDMIKDHTKAQKDLGAALGKGEGDVTDAPLAPKQAAMLKQLDAAEGDDFQTLYIEMQTAAHMEAVALFRTYSGAGDDEQVVAFAKKTLPTLEEHMMHVKQLVKAH